MTHALEVLSPYFELIKTHLIEFTIYISLFCCVAATASYALFSQKYRVLFWSIVGFIVIGFIFARATGDTHHHVYRIIALSQELRGNDLSLLLVNQRSGEALPTFVFYSFVPYLLPAALTLIGVSAIWAYKLFLLGLAIFLAIGIDRLCHDVARDDGERGRIFLLVGVLFMSANYIYGLWTVRSAMAEIWVCSLAPWVIWELLFGQGYLRLTVLLTLQLFGHPIVFPHAILGETVAAWGLSAASPRQLALRLLLATLGAFALSAPFWLPQLIWMKAILGPAALATSFSETFLPIRSLLSPFEPFTVGPWLMIMVAVAAVTSTRPFGKKIWALAVIFFCLLALQTPYAQGITERIVVISKSAFVWRLMYPCALIGFAGILAARRSVSPKVLTVVSSLAILNMGVVLAAHTPVRSLAGLFDRLSDDSYVEEYFKDQPGWGILEYMPNYATLPKICPPADAGVENKTFLDLRAGVHAVSPFVRISHAPIDMVDYYVDGAAAKASACGEDLVLGPLQPNATLSVSELKLTALLFARVAMMGLFLIGCVVSLRREEPSGYSALAEKSER